MRRLFRHDGIPALFVLICLLGLKGVHAAGWLTGPLQQPGDELVTTLANRDLNKEAREALTAGYYEGLINEGSRLSSMNRIVTGSRRVSWEDRDQPDRRQIDSFLFYELIPNSDVPDYRDDRARYRLKTNSAGMADREYALAKPEGTRRIAVMGDSVTRGQGAPFGGNYESLLEERLNELFPDRPVEILNFAVGSYSVMQMLDAAVEKAAAYEPDVYMVALTDLSVYRRWGQHLSLLLSAGIDLKYDYLRTLVREAGLTARDPAGVVDAKLARFRMPTIRWALTEIKAHAAAHGASVIVLLVPTADDPGVLAEEFLGVRQVLAELELPVVDLLDAFAEVDWASYRVAERDRHPNAEGHERLAELLLDSILVRPELTSVVVGSSGSVDEVSPR